MKKILFNVFAGIVALPSSLGVLIGTLMFFNALARGQGLASFVGATTGMYLIVGGSFLLMTVIFMHELFSKSIDGEWAGESSRHS